MIEPMSPNEPTVIGRYRILGVLGAGGMGRVLLGVGPDGRFVAIKQIHPHLVDDAEYRARFEREIRVSTRVSGAFTAALIDFQLTGPAPWLASVFISGVPLDRAVDDFGPLPPPAVRILASGLASALHSIHGTGLIHRDLKPANVILAADGPRVIDFGIAQPTEAGGLTEAGALIGSPAYMSPEQATGEPLTGASDIFSLGTLLFMAATGENPFAAASAPYTMFNVVHREAELDLVPSELRDLVGWCLRKHQDDRPTPARILDYLGVLPVQARPWPAAVHAEIEARGARLTQAVADPEATQVITGSALTGGPQHRPLPVVAPTPPRRRVNARLAVVFGVVALALAAGVTAFTLRGGNDAVSTPAAAGPTATVPDAAQLRGVDACAWLRAALGPTLPADVMGGAPMAADSWVWQPTSAWGCDGSSAAGRMTLTLGAATEGFTATGRIVNGLAQVRRGADCALGVDNGPAARRLGIVVDTAARGDCALAEHTLTSLTATLGELPRDPAAAQSLSSVDPCALVRDSELSALGVTGQGALSAAHECRWPGGARLRVTLAQLRTGDLSLLSKPVDLGDGIVVFDEDFTTLNQCARMYRFRSLGDTFVEVLTVELADPQRKREQLCPLVDAALAPMVSRLPSR